MNTLMHFRIEIENCTINCASEWNVSQLAASFVRSEKNVTSVSRRITTWFFEYHGLSFKGIAMMEMMKKARTLIALHCRVDNGCASDKVQSRDVKVFH